MTVVVYLAKLDYTNSLGVQAKIVDQMQSWEALSPHSKFALLIVHSGESLSQILADSAHSVIENSLFARYIFNVNLFFALRALSPDLIYLRFSSFPFLNIIHILLYRVVVELNTRFEYEALRYKNFMKRILLRFYYFFLVYFCDGVVGVTPDCIPSYSRRSIVIGNAISVLRSGRSKLDVDRASRELVFIGSPNCGWHGVDKIINIAERLDGYFFHIIGYTEDDLKVLGVGCVPCNVHAHGFLEYEQYVEIFQRCFVAIGSLAMERNKMFFSSSLKNREYLVHGLPVVIQGVDVDLLNFGSVYFLRESFTIDEFESAIETVRNKIPSYERLLRTIDSSNVEVNRLRFLHSFLPINQNCNYP